MNIETDSSVAQSIATEVGAMMAAVKALGAALEKEEFASVEDHLQFCAKDICPLMLAVRSHADALEQEVADELWPLPKYREMLFLK